VFAQLLRPVRNEPERRAPLLVRVPAILHASVVFGANFGTASFAVDVRFGQPVGLPFGLGHNALVILVEDEVAL